MDINFRNSLFILTLLFALISSANTCQADSLPISAYGSLPNVSNVKLSPNGNNIAFIQNENGTLILKTFDFNSGTSQAILQADTVEVVLNWYVWGNDDILLISAAYTSGHGESKHTSTRLYKFDLSADKKLKRLIKPKVNRGERIAQFQDNVISLMPAQPDKILMAIDFDIANKPSLYSVNIRTAQRSRIKRGKTYYAALMAAVKHGESFKCAASFAAVSNIERIVSNARHFTNKDVVKKQSGTDDDKLEATSPVYFSEQINIPILLIHGTDDKIVPVQHSRAMANDLENHDIDLRYIEIEDANHHLSVQVHRM